MSVPVSDGHPVWPGAGGPPPPDVIALYESLGGRLALLLRQTVVPLPEERHEWFSETRQASRSAITSLRRAGFRGECLVLQWRPLPEIAHVLRRWACRYDADPARRERLTRVVERYLADRRYLAARQVGVVPPALPPHCLPDPRTPPRARLTSG